jgi:hypothetical protein
MGFSVHVGEQFKGSDGMIFRHARHDQLVDMAAGDS